MLKLQTGMAGILGVSFRRHFALHYQLPTTGIGQVHNGSHSQRLFWRQHTKRLWAAIINARRGSSNIVLLTALGAGAFGNDPSWVNTAIRRALMIVRDFELDVRLVSYRAPFPAMIQLAEVFASH